MSCGIILHIIYISTNVVSYEYFPCVISTVLFQHKYVLHNYRRDIINDLYIFIAEV